MNKNLLYTMLIFSSYKMLIIIIYHAFLPTPRRGSHVKSGNTHSHHDTKMISCHHYHNSDDNVQFATTFLLARFIWRKEPILVSIYIVLGLPDTNTSQKTIL